MGPINESALKHDPEPVSACSYVRAWGRRGGGDQSVLWKRLNCVLLNVRTINVNKRTP